MSSEKSSLIYLLKKGLVLLEPHDHCEVAPEELDRIIEVESCNSSDDESVLFTSGMVELLFPEFRLNVFKELFFVPELISILVIIHFVEVWLLAEVVNMVSLVSFRDGDDRDSKFIELFFKVLHLEFLWLFFFSDMFPMFEILHFRRMEGFQVMRSIK